jgi:hypothetical protein
MSDPSFKSKLTAIQAELNAVSEQLRNLTGSVPVDLSEDDCFVIKNSVRSMRHYVSNISSRCDDLSVDIGMTLKLRYEQKSKLYMLRRLTAVIDTVPTWGELTGVPTGVTSWHKISDQNMYTAERLVRDRNTLESSPATSSGYPNHYTWQLWFFNSATDEWSKVEDISVIKNTASGITADEVVTSQPHMTIPRTGFDLNDVVAGDPQMTVPLQNSIFGRIY